ncbi:NTF2 fold immunity protein [Neptuniibacter sp. PT8_73]|uniref:NTF2 fold immunity protein n=1 Tax=Neptuniibacter sp. PT8_73 TaxID=3398206 RepID=UPI0039F4AA30
MFEASNYIKPTESLDTPESVVIACITAYKKWSKDCQSWEKEHKGRVSELSKGPAKDSHIQLRKHFCAPLNRQYHRSHSGYYFLGGIVDSEASVLNVVHINSKETEVYTKLTNTKNKQLKFHVVRQGTNWRIKSLSRNNGNNKWVDEYL